MLQRDDHLTTIDHEGRLLAVAATVAGPDAPVPTCPEWVVRDLVLHQGEVHRWATAVIAGGLAKPSLIPADHLGPLPDDAGLMTWFEDGHRALLDALRCAPDDLAAFTFLNDAPPAVLFWARRQAHETEMHRVDAESAAGGHTPVATASAADGIDEFLTGFVTRPRTPLRASTDRSLAVALTDHAAAWRLVIGEGPAVAERIDRARAETADCFVTGAAEDVYLALWNRRELASLTISGDAAVLDLFRANVRVSWA